MKSKFKQDFNSEQLLAKWLDEYFYKRILDDEYDINTKFNIIRPAEYGKERAREAQRYRCSLSNE